MESSPKISNSYNNTHEHGETLLPGLPDHLAQRCLALVPPSILFSVSHTWRRLIYSTSFPPFFSLYALLFPLRNGAQVYTVNSLEFFSLDPISSTWQRLPDPPSESPLNLLHRHPSFLSRKLPVQSLTVSNHLVLMTGTTHHFVPALTRPLVFHPDTKLWFFGPPFSIPRRWCATGSVRETVYLASGVASDYRGDVARSMEQWNMESKRENWGWEKMARLKDGRFSREAIEAVGFKGKLCMVNVKGNAVKEGLVYDVKDDKWLGMPEGMLEGWTGPVAAMKEDVLYVVDERKGTLCEYDGGKDCWRQVIELEELKFAEQITAGKGKICAVCENGERLVVVDVLANPARVWIVKPPSGLQLIAVHILPRMSRQE
ncbi:hypothetical protein K2173_026888 [Erythroxylum novogranatense]|uniref:F-box/kelch-repeat protein SKIP25-like n=1 Tax=Erythroxylum novogranatense TaxID=1862640 RepID=A0AAV8TXI2_9ROSI|nr:hypothetical protein K2173_026888 [Erythroxylum novogranatense]